MNGKRSGAHATNDLQQKLKFESKGIMVICRSLTLLSDQAQIRLFAWPMQTMSLHHKTQVVFLSRQQNASEVDSTLNEKMVLH